MVDGIDKAGAVDPTRLRPSTTSTPATPAAAPVAPAPAAAAASSVDLTNLISLLAGSAPPVDSKKVEAIQSLIASGAYPIDQHAIAAKMLALDFPQRGASADA
jgi:flagellar biosynthesis anti-sigma factor FlgM